MLNKLTLVLLLIAAWVTAESGEETGTKFGALIVAPALDAIAAPAVPSGPSR